MLFGFGRRFRIRAYISFRPIVQTAVTLQQPIRMERLNDFRIRCVWVCGGWQGTQSICWTWNASTHTLQHTQRSESIIGHTNAYLNEIKHAISIYRYENLSNAIYMCILCRVRVHSVNAHQTTLWNLYTSRETKTKKKNKIYKNRTRRQSQE